ncbi:MAG: hypothetical protein U0R44_05495 [Candidatus Micrarchaeia archaeon]
MSGPYRSHSPSNTRCGEFIRKMRCALGMERCPLLEDAVHDREAFDTVFSLFASTISDLVTDWYAPFLLREIRTAWHYEDAIASASLLAYSEKPGCIESLAGLLRSRRPLDVLVGIETLGDLVAFSPPGTPRSMAVYHLERCGQSLAGSELECALMLSRHGYPEPAYLPPADMIQSPCAANRFYIPA